MGDGYQSFFSPLSDPPGFPWGSFLESALGSAFESPLGSAAFDAAAGAAAGAAAAGAAWAAGFGGGAGGIGTPARSSSSLITWAKLSVGWAPTNGRPLMKNDGVEPTPYFAPSSRSFWMSFWYLSESRHWLNCSALSPRS